MKEKTGPKKGRQVIVLGAGFGGLEFCKIFSLGEAEIIVIDRQNHHLFQPLLYQVASAGLSAPEIAQPIRQILSGRTDISITLDEVLAIDLNKRKVRLRESDTKLTYDYLIIALGPQTNYFGNDSWSAYSHRLKTLDDATRIRHRVLLAFEKAEYAGNDSIRERLMADCRHWWRTDRGGVSECVCGTRAPCIHKRLSVYRSVEGEDYSYRSGSTNFIKFSRETRKER